MTKNIMVITLCSSALVLSACSKKEPTASQTNSKPTWLLASAPSDVTGIADAKQGATEGDQVTIRGIIGGRKDAVNDSAAMFVMVDTHVHNECVSGDDHCKTPWDYCCASIEEVTQNSATVQLVDESGKPLSIHLASVGVLPLDTVVVVGTVGPRPTQEVLTIKAMSLFNEGH